MTNDLDSVNDELGSIELEVDYTEQTGKIRKKLFRKIWVVFWSTVVIIISYLFDKNNDFDVVLESSLFRIFLYITITVCLFAIIFTYNKKALLHKERTFKKYKVFSEIVDVLYIIPVFMAVISLSNEFFISPSFIDGESMEPNYYHGDDILFWHLNPKYERYDVVILKAPSNDYWIKRVIGLPGDVIVIDDGVVYVNEEKINQDFLIDENGSIDEYTVCRSGDKSYCSYEVPEDSYFVLGDNRDVSDDSRSPNLGYVSRDQLYGKVVLKFNNIFRN